MKTTILSLLLFVFIIGFAAIAQEKEPDVMPEPVGGIEAIMKNVVYPKSAKDAGIEGKVIVDLIIDEKGNVTYTEILKSVNDDLDKAALDAITKTKFTPALKDNKPVKAKVTLPIMFKLN